MISRLHPLLTKFPLLARPLALAGGYAAFTALARIICLSLVTFGATFLAARAGGVAKPSFSEIAESFAAFEILSAALSAVIFVIWLRWRFPASGLGSTELFNSKRIEARFLPGFLTGALLAAAWVFCFLYLGQYEYVGWYLQVEESPAGLVLVLVRALALIAWVYCEEFLFRRKLLPAVADRLGGPENRDWVVGLAAATVTTVVYVCVKILQFDLGWTYALNLALLSLILSLRALTLSDSQGDFVTGAAYAIGLYVVFNPVLGLPLLGSEFSGLVALKPMDHQDEWTRRLIGGTGGPFSGFGMSVLLAIELARAGGRFLKSRVG